MAVQPAMPDLADAPEIDADQRVVLNGVTWEQYEALLALFGDDQPGIRVSYLEGSLEIMSPSRRHEGIKSLMARLVEAYVLAADLPVNSLGSATFRQRAHERGVEPDECWFLGDDEGKDVPDIAFEVIITSGGLDRLSLYAGLGVPEVWFWRRGQILIYRLAGAAYERCPRSEALPGLDVAGLARFVERRNQTEAVKAFLASLRDTPS
jgi:Uma2 family endonuclease